MNVCSLLAYIIRFYKFNLLFDRSDLRPPTNIVKITVDIWWAN